MHYKAGNQSNQEGYGQNRTGKMETLGEKKNLSGNSQGLKITITSSQVQKNPTAHRAFRNPSLHSWGQYHGMLEVPCAVSDGSSTKQTHVTKREKNWGKKQILINFFLIY